MSDKFANAVPCHLSSVLEKHIEGTMLPGQLRTAAKHLCAGPETLRAGAPCKISTGDSGLQ